MKKEELQRTEKHIEKRTETGPRRNTWEHMWRFHGISKNRTLCFNSHEAKDMHWEISWDSTHWHSRISRECNSRSDTTLNIWKNYFTELYDPANRPEILKVETEDEVNAEEKDPELKWKKLPKRRRMKQATRDGDIPGDVLKLLGGDGLRIMIQIINNAHETRERSKDRTEVTIITLKTSLKGYKMQR
jgi:hypothetical protein